MQKVQTISLMTCSVEVSPPPASTINSNKQKHIIEIYENILQLFPLVAILRHVKGVNIGKPYDPTPRQLSVLRIVDDCGRGLDDLLKGLIPAYFLCFRLKSTEK